MPAVSSTVYPGTVETIDALSVRPMEPADEERLVRFHSRLSNETTHLRFFSVHPSLTHAELVRFTHVDHGDREALVAVLNEEIIGVARYDRLVGADEAEVALVIEDAWQHHGVGTLLFRRLCETARTRGIRCLVADTLPDNSRMLRLFDASGLVASKRFADGVVRVVMPLAPRG
jgi:RimJ/RimL family protein N-acetyltransferase